MSTPLTPARHSQVVPLIFASALITGLLGMSKQQEAMRMERLEIMKDGRVVAIVSGDAHGGRIQLFNAAGKEMLSLGATEGGGASLIVSDRLGDRVLKISSDERDVRITTSTRGRELLVFESDEVDDPDELGTVGAIQDRLRRLSTEVLTLEHQQHDLDRQLNDLNSPLAGGSTVSRLQRDLSTLSREFDELTRDHRHATDDLRRHKSDLDDLRRRISRLESRRPQE